MAQKSILNFFQNGNKSIKDNEVKASSSCSHNVAECESQIREKQSLSDNDHDVQQKRKKIKGNFIRHYDNKYLKLGFTIAPGTEKIPRPLCVVCNETLANESMKPSNLSRHLHTKHRELVNKPLEYFERLLKNVTNQKQILKKSTVTDKTILRSSYLTALKIAQSKKPFTIGEELIKPCMVEVVNEMLGFEAAKKIDLVPLSDSTMQRRINIMAEDIENQVLEAIRKSAFFAIQMDETTDISNHAILLCFARFIHEENVKEELLCYINLPGRTTSAEIFKWLNDYFKVKKLDWKKCVGVCSDGAANMTGRNSGVVKQIRDVSHPDMMYTHCIIHREQLASKKMSPELHQVLNDVIRIVNEIRARALNSRLFNMLCESMGSENTQLLLHAEVRWLSRGKTLSRFFELREEINIFLREQNSSFAEKLVDEEWIAKLAYLADIFTILNDLNLTLQGNMKNIFTLWNKMDAFRKKLMLWEQSAIKCEFKMFHRFDDILSTSDINNINLEFVKTHLNSLIKSFHQYYPENEDPRNINLWITNPFISLNEVNAFKLSIHEKEALIELSSDISLKTIFQSNTLEHFWISTMKEYPSLSVKALKLLLCFSTTYLCEKTFSSLSVIKTKHRNRLDADAALRLAETSLLPRIDKIIDDQQQQISH